MRLEFRLNGRPILVDSPPGRRLLDLLRGELGLPGTKEGCGEGECGACTVLVDGRPRLACLMLAAQLPGADVHTVEGLAQAGELHPLQKAFVEQGAVQCGFCTPGLLMASYALLKENPQPTREEVREYLAGNLCRCTGYNQVIDAVLSVAKGELCP
ncbi:MAG: (2Fe-2S)-binding protein [Candidatus Bipolaricaulota bacterium]